MGERHRTYANQSLGTRLELGVEAVGPADQERGIAPFLLPIE